MTTYKTIIKYCEKFLASLPMSNSSREICLKEVKRLALEETNAKRRRLMKEPRHTRAGSFVLSMVVNPALVKYDNPVEALKILRREMRDQTLYPEDVYGAIERNTTYAGLSKELSRLDNHFGSMRAFYETAGKSIFKNPRNKGIESDFSGSWDMAVRRLEDS